MKILIAPLDWGLGHTTRCFPLIRYFLSASHSVFIAAEGSSAKLIRENFPGINILPLKGYRISYSRYSGLFRIKILTQVPKIIQAIRTEHRWLRKIQSQYHFDFIISDNRYGLYLSGLPSFILTHQLKIKTGLGKLADGWIQFLNYRLLNRFTECWVVDNAEGTGVSGSLGHPKTLPKNARYIGILSQFIHFNLGSPPPASHHKILILLSGPEPMRGILQSKLLAQIKELKDQQFIFVAGNITEKQAASLPSHISYFSFLTAKELLPILQVVDLVICRSGYSTILDLAMLQKKALFIPTPGQAEQEYLAKYLYKRNLCYFENQKDVNLHTAIPKALNYSGFCENNNKRKKELTAFLEKIVLKIQEGDFF